MSDDRHKDDKVSATYRKLATEHTPDQLDRKILAMAAKNPGRPSYSRWISWSRPLAWAATITLCLAITLELVREPALQPTVAPVPESQVGPALRDVHEEAITTPDAATPTDTGREARHEAFTLSATEDRDEDKASDDANQSLARPEPLQEAAGSTAKIGSADKEELARMRSSVQAGTAPPAEAARARRSPETSERAFSGESDSADQACAEERRATAETWHECILELEAAGLDAAAGRERDELKNSFPDFKRP